jgi:hypothetical protein
VVTTRYIAEAATLRDYLAPAGFAGVAILIAAIIMFCAVLYVSRRAATRHNEQLEQRDRDLQKTREDQQRAAAIDRCWNQFWKLVDTAGEEPTAQHTDEASLGLGPELALELLQGMLRDAKELRDDTLAGAVRVYLSQYGLVLGQQGGPLPAAAPGRDGQAPSSPDAKPAAAARAAADEKPPAAAEMNPREGRHR